MAIKWSLIDWTLLRGRQNPLWENFVNMEDVDEYISQKICSATIVTRVSIATIISSNSSFFYAKNELFSKFPCIEKRDPRLQRVQEMFRIPVIA